MAHARQETVLLRPGKLDLASLRQLARSPAPVRLAEGCWAAVEASARALERIRAGRQRLGATIGHADGTEGARARRIR